MSHDENSYEAYLAQIEADEAKIKKELVGYRVRTERGNNCFTAARQGSLANAKRAARDHAHAMEKHFNVSAAILEMNLETSID